MSLVVASAPGRRRSAAARPAGRSARTASKSPGEAIGKPASMTSTPSSLELRAISSFSCEVQLTPGDCSPSRRVVSKIVMSCVRGARLPSACSLLRSGRRGGRTSPVWSGFRVRRQAARGRRLGSPSGEGGCGKEGEAVDAHDPTAAGEAPAAEILPGRRVRGDHCSKPSRVAVGEGARGGLPENPPNPFRRLTAVDGILAPHVKRRRGSR